MIDGFLHTPAGELVFGAGAVDRLGTVIGRRAALVVTDAGVVAAGILDVVLAAMDAPAAAVFADVEANPSTDTVARGTGVARDSDVGVVVAVGGGSAMDAAKVIAHESGELPVIAIPTTAGTGAETNGFGVISDGHRKVYLGGASSVPKVCLLDPVLTHGLPPGPTAATGVDALVHAVESLMSRGRTPLTEAYAHRALAMVSAWLPTVVADGANAQARAHMLLGAHLAGLALSGSGLGLVHGLAHAITAYTGATHGSALASVVDEVLALNLAACVPEFAEMAHDLGVGSSAVSVSSEAAADRIGALVRDAGVYRPLGEHGVTRELVPAIAEAALADPVILNAPVRPEPERLRALITTSL